MDSSKVSIKNAKSMYSNVCNFKCNTAVFSSILNNSACKALKSINVYFYVLFVTCLTKFHASIDDNE